MKNTYRNGLLCCGIMEKEITAILPELIQKYGDIDVTYLDPGLHVNLDKLSAALSTMHGNEANLRQTHSGIRKQMSP